MNEMSDFRVYIINDEKKKKMPIEIFSQHNFHRFLERHSICQQIYTHPACENLKDFDEI